MNLVDFYYKHIVGQEPKEESYNKTNKLIAYLKEADIEEALIIKVLEDVPHKDYLTHEDLPNWLWENSILKPKTFYYHHSLQITSPAPKYNMNKKYNNKTKFYLEMKIKYTVDDLIDYFYNTLGVPLEFKDKKKDGGAINYLLSKYSNFTFIEPIDFVLALIERDKSENLKVNNILDLTKHEQEVYNQLQALTANAKIAKANIIRWR